jgi:hypothetical protein
MEIPFRLVLGVSAEIMTIILARMAGLEGLKNGTRSRSMFIMVKEVLQLLIRLIPSRKWKQSELFVSVELDDLSEPYARNQGSGRREGKQGPYHAT